MSETLNERKMYQDIASIARSLETIAKIYKESIPPPYTHIVAGRKDSGLCPTCDGEGTILDKTSTSGQKLCKDCNGTGLSNYRVTI